MHVRIHYLAWLGAAIDAYWIFRGITALFQHIHPGYTFGLLPPPAPLLFWLHVWLYLCVILQIAALILLPAFKNQSTKLAVFSAVFCLPCSLLYLYGMKKSLAGTDNRG